MTGFVSLVGAGPGDPELLTLRAVDRLRAADLVLYDALVDRGALRHAPHAVHAYVGKRAGRHSIDQRTLERVMIRRALRGERVVRLKSGDPFVFGRGGEEALALAAAGVPCEIVPGVSAAVAAPALCGIPLTHRGLSAAFVVVSGHAEEAYAPGAALAAARVGHGRVADGHRHAAGDVGAAPRAGLAVRDAGGGALLGLAPGGNHLAGNAGLAGGGAGGGGPRRDRDRRHRIARRAAFRRFCVRCCRRS